MYMHWQDPDSLEVVVLDKDFGTMEVSASFSEAEAFFQCDVLAAELTENLHEDP